MPLADARYDVQFNDATACALPGIVSGERFARRKRGPDRTRCNAWRLDSSGHRLGATLGATVDMRSRTLIIIQRLTASI